jgi:hypothetical protein
MMINTAFSVAAVPEWLSGAHAGVGTLRRAFTIILPAAARHPHRHAHLHRDRLAGDRRG